MNRRHRYYSEFKIHVWVWELWINGVALCSIQSPYGYDARNRLEMEFLSCGQELPACYTLIPTHYCFATKLQGELYE